MVGQQVFTAVPFAFCHIAHTLSHHCQTKGLYSIGHTSATNGPFSQKFEPGKAQTKPSIHSRKRRDRPPARAAISLAPSALAPLRTKGLYSIGHIFATDGPFSLKFEPGTAQTKPSIHSRKRRDPPPARAAILLAPSFNAICCPPPSLFYYFPKLCNGRQQSSLEEEG